MDTGADVNVIAESTLRGMDPIALLDWDRGDIEACGQHFRPEKKVELRFRIRGKKRIYEAEFAVFNESRAEAFDMLLGNGFIREHGFLIQSHRICLISSSTE